jgi:hypothetical protein
MGVGLIFDGVIEVLETHGMTSALDTPPAEFRLPATDGKAYALADVAVAAP